MNLKQRFSLFFSSLFSLLLASVMVTIYVLFSNFRQDEFKTRLIQRATTTVKVLVSVKGLDRNLLKLFDKHRVNKLYNEKTSVYNHQLKLIYTSNESYPFNWSKRDFD